jgi:hypothetical protein
VKEVGVQKNVKSIQFKQDGLYKRKYNLVFKFKAFDDQLREEGYNEDDMKLRIQILIGL